MQTNTLKENKMGVMPVGKLLLNMAVCCMILIVGAICLEPVMAFVETLQEIGKLDEDLIGIMFKTVGIGLLGEIAGLICADAGQSALGKGIQFLTSVMILWLGIPLMTGVIELIQSIMGEI